MMNLTMLCLGSFRFCVATAAYQTLERTREYKWAELQRLGRHDALQYTGPGADTITLQGAIYPEYTGSMWEVEELAALADTGAPQLLISATGVVFGDYVIMSIGETQSIFAALGIPRKQEFTLALRYFED